MGPNYSRPGFAHLKSAFYNTSALAQPINQSINQSLYNQYCKYLGSVHAYRRQSVGRRPDTADQRLMVAVSRRVDDEFEVRHHTTRHTSTTRPTSPSYRQLRTPHNVS